MTDDGRHDFDFEFGAWDASLRRLLHPLAGPGASAEWVTLTGSSVVHRLLGGQANIGELDVANHDGAIRGLTLRLFDPAARRWRIHWISVATGEIGDPVGGGFERGEGEFRSHETLDGREIEVRYRFTAITGTSFTFEQAFSADGGATWEPNWVAGFTRRA